MKDKVLIIGANSLIGHRLFLMDLPDEVVFTARTPQDPRVQPLDLERLARFAPSFTPRWVVVCVPIWHLSYEALHHFYDLGCERMIVFSSTSRFTKDVSGEPEEIKLAEKLKAGEERVIGFCAEHNMTYTLLRPTLIYDEGRDSNISRVKDFIEKYGLFPLSGFGSGLRQPVHARDLAEAVLKVLSEPKTKNRAYTLSGAEKISYREMVVRVFKALNKPVRLIPLPLFVFKIVFFMRKLLGKDDPLSLNVQMIERMNEDLAFDHGRAREDFGYAPNQFLPQFNQPSNQDESDKPRLDPENE